MVRGEFNDTDHRNLRGRRSRHTDSACGGFTEGLVLYGGRDPGNNVLGRQPLIHDEMSDETNSLLGIAQTGWGVAIIAATWGIVLRAILGRRDAKERKIEERLENLEKTVSDIQVSIATIAGRMLERDVRGNYTWPGDKR